MSWWGILLIVVGTLAIVGVIVIYVAGLVADEAEFREREWESRGDPDPPKHE